MNNPAKTDMKRTLKDAIFLFFISLAVVNLPFASQILDLILIGIISFKGFNPTGNFIIFLLMALVVANFKETVSMAKRSWYQFSVLITSIFCLLLVQKSSQLPGKIFLFFIGFALLNLIFKRFREGQDRLRRLNVKQLGVDDPLADPDDDKLDRASFAKNIFQVVQNLPDKNTRIAITGEWGYGKTSCLNFIGSYAKQEGFPVIEYNPWKYTNKDEAWKGFIAALDKGMAGWKDECYGPFSLRRIFIKAYRVFHVRIISSEVGRLFDDLFLSRFQSSFDINKEYVSARVREMLGSKKLLILIDDVDRAPSDIVYQVLLLIKEIIDINGCVFICGIDIGVTESVLENNYGKRDGKAFLGKIFQFFFPLAEPKIEDKSAFVDYLLERVNPPVRRSIIKDIEKMLPNNPRKLKLYFRTLSSLDGLLLERFGDQDLSWEFLYLAELLKNKYPERTVSVLNETAFFEWLHDWRYYNHDRKRDEGRVKELEKWKKVLDSKEFSDKKKENLDFLAILEKLAELGYGLDKARMESYFNILSYSESLSWKEYFEWKEFSGEDLLRELKDANLSILRRREFLLAIMREREQKLSYDADEWNHDKRETYMAEAIKLTKTCIWLVEQEELKDLSSVLFDGVVVEEWLKLLSNWAHFKNGEHYKEIRSLEKELATKMTRFTENIASEILNTTQVLGRSALTDAERAFVVTAQEVREIYLRALSGQLIESFTKEDSIKGYWGQNHARQEKNLLFGPNKYLYNTQNREKLLELAKRAENDRVIQGNFYELLRMLLWAATDSASSIPRDPAMKLIEDDELREAFWRAGTKQRINRRSMGGFLEDRKKISQELNRTDIFLLPDWVISKEKDLLELFKIEGDIPDDVEIASEHKG